MCMGFLVLPRHWGGVQRLCKGSLDWKNNHWHGRWPQNRDPPLHQPGEVLRNELLGVGQWWVTKGLAVLMAGWRVVRMEQPVTTFLFFRVLSTQKLEWCDVFHFLLSSVKCFFKGSIRTGHLFFQVIFFNNALQDFFNSFQGLVKKP